MINHPLLQHVAVLLYNYTGLPSVISAPLEKYLPTPLQYYGVVRRNAHTLLPLRSTKMSTIHVAMVFHGAGTRDTLENDDPLIFAVICTAYMV